MVEEEVGGAREIDLCPDWRGGAPAGTRDGFVLLVRLFGSGC